MAASMKQHDQLLMTLTSQHQSIEGLLDTFFDFLHRKTDLYVVTKDPMGRHMGFLPGHAKEKVVKAFEKYPYKHIDTEEPKAKPKPTTTAVTKEKPVNNSKPTAITATRPTPSIQLTDDGKQIPIGNGGVTSKYTWTQSLYDVTIQVDVPVGTRSRDLQCAITSTGVQIALKPNANHNNTQRMLLEGSFPEKIRADESLWSLEGNKTLQISLEKIKKTWWPSAFVGDDEIDTSKVDSTMQLHEYDETTQGALRKVLFDESQKAQGLPTSDEMQMNTLLQQAKDLPRSPFASSASHEP